MVVKTIPEQQCLRCTKPSGTKIVCDECRVELTPSQIQRMDHTYQLMVIELFGRSCVDCGHSAAPESGELCGDHLDTKGSTPEGRYDLANAVCRCMNCHNKRGSGEIEREPAEEKMPKQTQERAKKRKFTRCSYFNCPLMPTPSSKKGRCAVHFNK